MTMANTRTIDQCIGRTLFDADGDRIGKIQDVYLDDQTGQPEWFAVSTGWFGSRISFVPIQGASSEDDDLAVPYSKNQVKEAPNAEPDGRLTQEEEARLYSHYGLRYGERRSDSGLPEGGRTTKGDAGTRTQRDTAMTRSEEEMVAGKRKEAKGKVRLVKYVETEHVNVTVPVTRERAKLVTEPITDANRDEALRGKDIKEGVHEETLYEEEPVVEKRTVPKERVRLEKETVTDEERVEGEVRKERIRTEGDVDKADRRR
jgi:uncharacterized protein (TIGR02271 family)